MKVIILAAGKGTRLHPITENRPKHLLEVGGKPILQWQIEELLLSKIIDEIIIVVNYHADQIKEAVGNWTDDKRIKFIQQSEMLGTGDAVRTGLATFDCEDKFMVINGDTIVDGSITEMISSEYESVVLGAVVKNPNLFGVLTSDENGFLKAIEEKPENPKQDAYINAGVYIFPANSKELFLHLSPSKRGELEIPDVLNSIISDGIKVKIIKHGGRWFDIGHPWQLLDANEYLMDKYHENYKILGNIEPGAQLRGNIHVAKTARIRSGVYIEGPAFIDEGADIGPNCYIRSRSYIGRGVRIGNACEIKNSIVYSSTHIAHLSYVGDSIIGQNSNFGAGTITANLRHDGKEVLVTIKDKRMKSGRRKLGVIMGDNVKTGIGASILPGVKIRSGTWINAHELIKRDK